MTNDTTVDLSVGIASVRVVPGAGGRLGRVTIFDHDVLVSAADAGASDDIGTGAHPMQWGSFPMVPWVGRIRDGRFRYRARTHHLPVNLPPHSIHGVAFDRPWTVTGQHHDDDIAEVALAIDLDWAFGGSATQEIRLGPGGLRCRLAVHAGRRPMPAEVGWHPWFVKPDHLWFEPRAMYRRDESGITTGEPVPVGPDLDLGDPAGDPATDPHRSASTRRRFDDCFVNDRPATLVVGDVALTITSDADHWVLYDEPAHATCVEPQSGPPDAFNLRPRVLRPGETLERTMLWAWSTPV